MSTKDGRLARTRAARVATVGTQWLQAQPESPLRERVRAILFWHYEDVPEFRKARQSPMCEAPEEYVRVALVDCGCDMATAARWAHPPKCQRNPFSGRSAQSVGHHRGACDRGNDRVSTLGVFAYPYRMGGDRRRG